MSLDAIRSELMKLSEKLTSGTVAEWEKYKYARDVELYVNINKELDKLGQKTLELNQDLIKKSHKVGYAVSMYDIDKQTGFKFAVINSGFANIPYGTIAKLMNDADFLASVSDLKAKAKRNIKQTISQGLIQGKGIPEISKGIKDSLGMSATRAVRIARTETQKAVNSGALDGTNYAQENGVKLVKQWISTKDSRTRPDHVAMDRQIAETEGTDGQMYFKTPEGDLGLAPGQFGIANQDIACRCSYVNITEDYQAPVIPQGIKTDFSNFNQWVENKFGAQ
jgi:SPP1 gp7 family putative phage head morphogenesis protein